MAEKLYQHWRNFTDLKYLRAELFQPKEEKVLTIAKIVQEQVKSSKGDLSEKPVAYFEEKDVLPMVLNVTNCEIIEKTYNSGNIYDWIGKKIQVYATNTKVAGEQVPCLRVRKFVPQGKEPEYKCSVCGTNISEKTYHSSKAKYGAPYCSAECLNKDKNGENIL